MTQNLCPPQMLRAWQKELTFGKHDHVGNVVAIMCPRFAGPFKAGLHVRRKHKQKHEPGPFADSGHTTQTSSPMALWMTVTGRPQKEIYGSSNSQVRALLSKSEITREFVGRRLLENTGVLSSNCPQTIPMKGCRTQRQT